MLRLAPDALLSADDDVLEALIDIAERERTHELWSLEAQAATVELVHATWRVTVQANAKRHVHIPVLRVDRPWAKTQRASGGHKISVTEFARMLGPAREG